MTQLKIGDQAPAIEAKDQNGKTFLLSSLLGKKVILYFYPKDMTPGCTDQACNLRDNHAPLKKKGFEVIGVSADTEKSHQKFIEKHTLPFTLLADTDKKIVQDYGVWGPKKFMGRTFDGIHRVTFVIDEKGKIAYVFEKVDTKDHTQQILNALN